MNIGDFVRYRRTGTIGKVIDIMEIDGKIWTQLDNELYYDANYLEPVSEREFQEKRDYKVKETSKKDELLEKLLEKEEVEFSGEVCGAG